MNRKYLAFSLITIFLFFFSLEIFARLISVTGSYDFIERTIIQQGLKVHKKPGEFRIFLFGESTMHGSFLFPKSTIKKWVELYVEDLLGEEAAKNINIINFGRLGCDSSFMLQSFKDTLVYKPDLVVFYTAHNDFIQLEYRDEILKKASLGKSIGELFQELSKKSVFVSVMKRLAVRAKIKRAEKREKENKDEWYVEEEKKFNPGTDLIEPKSSDFKKIQDHWENNVRSMIKTAQRHSIPVVFFESLSRYKDFKPFYSKHSKTLTEVQLKKWQEIFDAAEQSFKEERYFEAMVAYRESLEIDPQYALTLFRLGQCFEKLGDYKKAYDYYINANEFDYSPIRAPKVVNEFYEQLAVERLKDVYIIPTQKIFDGLSLDGLVNGELVADQLHPTMKGQAIMAKEIVKVISEHHLMKNVMAWNWKNERTFDQLAKKIDIDDDFECSIQLWLANYVGSYCDTAEQYLKKALQLKPQSIRAQSQLAWVYWKAGRKEEAKQIYKSLSEQVPDQAKIFFQNHPDLAKELSLKF